MAFNNWDKLEKAQRDYPKAKFAVGVVDKALKKQANNPYLLTWKADLALQQCDSDVETIAKSVLDVHRQSINDARLLVYMYRVSIEAMRRTTLGLLTTGSVILGCWQSAAKTLQRKKDRAALWETLSLTAMQEDCWEDVRFAILNYNKEGTSDKKQAHYSLILATQLAAEQKFAHNGSQDRMARLQCDLVLKLIKQAYTAPMDDPIAVKNIRDLRFMASIFGRQSRCSELQSLWADPPEHLKAVLDRHRQDLSTLMMKLLQEQKDWVALERHCLDLINDTVTNLSLVSRRPETNFGELCAWRWDIWASLLNALHGLRPGQEGRKIVSELTERCFGSKLEATDRPLRLTHIKLRNYVGVSTLDDCKDYFRHHSSLTSCFNDLRSIVTRLPQRDGEEFMAWALSELLQSPEPSKIDEVAWKSWQQREANWLKFMYMLAVSRPKDLNVSVLLSILKMAVKMSLLWEKDSDSGCLVVYMLLRLHYERVCGCDHLNPLETELNSRLLLQATMFARHLVEMDKDKENRTFALLAARLHLNLGLGTIAFRLYRHTKCKEMLLDTLSPYMLSRISQTHPFEVKGYGGFSADKELVRVIETIETMEKKTDSYLFTDLPSFLWDQVTDTLELKRKLNGSLTKHLCVAERRRIARLKGESIDNLPVLNIKAYTNMSDNVDYTVLPNFEVPFEPNRVLEMIMPNSVPNEYWLPLMHYEREKVMRELHGESRKEDFDANDSVTGPDGVHVGVSYRTRAEDLTQDAWSKVDNILLQCRNPSSREVLAKLSVRAAKDEGTRAEALQLLKNINGARKSMEKLRMPGNTTLKPEDEPTMFHENMLMMCYGKMELCRGLVKLADVLNDKVFKAKSKTPHPLKALLPDNYVSELQDETQIYFQALRDIAQSYIDLIKRRGLVAIKAQVRWGDTGELLRVFLSDDDVHYYAREYVDSALEAWNGVLKVKLK